VFPVPTPLHRAPPRKSGLQLQLYFSQQSLITEEPPFRICPSKDHLHERPPLGTEHVSITLPDGRRRYLSIRQPNNINQQVTNSSRQGFLSRPIEEIAKEAELRMIANVAKRSEIDECIQPVFDEDMVRNIPDTNNNFSER
jgi:hypothetical protein